VGSARFNRAWQLSSSSKAAGYPTSCPTPPVPAQGSPPRPLGPAKPASASHPALSPQPAQPSLKRSCRHRRRRHRRADTLAKSFEAPLKEFVRAVKAVKKVIADRSAALTAFQQVRSLAAASGPPAWAKVGFREA
jgi:hypothetical protein